MKKILILGLSMGIALFVQSCRPKSDPDPTTSSSTPQSSQTSDQSRVSDATSHASDEANNAVSNESSLSGNRIDETLALPCNVVITTVAGDAFSRLLTFNGVSCDGRYNRTGTAKVTLIPATSGAKWKDYGSKLSITLNNLKVTQISDGEYVILNGTQLVTNVSTSNWAGLLAGQPVKHKVKGDYEVTFSDNSKRTWQEARLRSLQYFLSSLSFKYTLEGDTILAGVTGNEKVSDWGKNRNNDDFKTTIITPITVENCTSKYKFTAGKAKHYIPQGTLTVLFSSNSAGSEVNGCGGTGYFMSWLGTSTTSSGQITTVNLTQYNPY